MKIFFAKYGLFILFYILVVALICVGAWKYREMSHELQELKANPPKLQQVVQDDKKSLVATVGKLMKLPAEDPTIAQVSDATKLKDQPFFSGAQNGDQVLIYTNARKAILYRPSTNQIIDVAPVNIGNSATASGQTPSTPSAIFPPATPSAAPRIIVQ